MSATTSETTKTLIAVIDIFRNLHFDFPTQYIHTFLVVALNQGVSNKDIAEATGLSNAATSRNIKSLSPDRGKGIPGYNLLDWQVSPDDARKRVVFLTERGKELYRKVLMELGHKETDPLPEPAEPHSFKSDRKEVQPTYFAATKKVYGRDS